MTLTKVPPRPLWSSALVRGKIALYCLILFYIALYHVACCKGSHWTVVSDSNNVLLDIGAHVHFLKCIASDLA